MIQKKPTLGRGLADLLGQARAPVAPVSAPATTRAPGDQLIRLPVDLLQRGRYQPRSDMRQESLTELADSIRVQGIVQPIVVRPLARSGDTEQRYEIIAGERRWRAAQMAGLAEVPAVVRDVPDEAAVAMALIENIQREDLNPLEEARALERLIAEFGLTHQQAADAVGRSRAAVSNLLRLLELAPEVCERLVKRELEMGHARALLAVAPRARQIDLAGRIAREHLTVRETEALVRRAMAPPSAAPTTPASKALDPNIHRLQQDLAEKIGAAVAIEHSSGGAGRVVIRYNNLDELDGILGHIQ